MARLVILFQSSVTCVRLFYVGCVAMYTCKHNDITTPKIVSYYILPYFMGLILPA